jgi:acetyl-CoA/propionyl-CoA carboxylase carboxyl transferase subunit
LQRAVDLGVIDAVIEPSQTRRELVRAIAEAPQLRGAHANIPL